MVVIGLAVDQDQVGVDVTVPMIFPRSGQRVIAMASVDRPVGSKVGQDVYELRVEGLGEPALLLAPVVSLEGRRPPNRPH